MGVDVTLHGATERFLRWVATAPRPEVCEELASFPDQPRHPFIALGDGFHVLHYAVTGDTNLGAGPAPLDAFVAGTGGAATGPSLGLGPALYLAPARTHDIAHALGDLSEELIRERVDAMTYEKHDEIYKAWGLIIQHGAPPVVTRNFSGADAVALFREVRAFYFECANRRLGVLVCAF